MGKVGTVWQLIHWGPMIALSVIFTITCASIRCHLMWWPMSHGSGAICSMVVFILWNALTLYNYFRAAIVGPGFVPFGWKPPYSEDEKFLQFCEQCQAFKSPRSHHCRKCERCVMKMDHHCPWINTCCGHFNHLNFVLFLFFAVCGCIQASYILICSLYRALNVHWYMYYTSGEGLVILGIGGFIFTMFSVGLAIGVIIAVGALFVIQMKSIIKNESGIESWIIDKALDRDREEDEEDFIYPYNLGWKENLKEVFTFTGSPVSDGFTWHVVAGCNQYTLTIEQIKQKAEKRDRTVHYIIIEDYTGSLFPITKGCKVCLRIPCTDEPRIPLQKGHTVLVTRWKRHWLYGSRILSSNELKEKKRIRGWFPRKCAKELVCDNGIERLERYEEKKAM